MFSYKNSDQTSLPAIAAITSLLQDEAPVEHGLPQKSTRLSVPDCQLWTGGNGRCTVTGLRVLKCIARPFSAIGAHMQKFRVCQTRVAQVARTAARKGKNLEVRLSMGAKHAVRGKIQSAPEPGSATRLLELWWQLVAASRSRPA